jgi:hypothetical protein
MSDSNTLNRREFTAKSALALLSGVTITVSACGGSSSSPSSPSPSPASGSAGTSVIASIGANHGHTGVITRAELTAGGALMLNIQGSADHPHTVQVTAPEVMQIAGGGRVVKTSSNDDGHTHSVAFDGGV